MPTNENAPSPCRHCFNPLEKHMDGFCVHDAGIGPMKYESRRPTPVPLESGEAGEALARLRGRAYKVVEFDVFVKDIEILASAYREKCEEVARLETDLAEAVWARGVSEQELARLKGREVVAWAVTCNGDFTDNIFTLRHEAETTMNNLNAACPWDKRAIVPLVRADEEGGGR